MDCFNPFTILFLNVALPTLVGALVLLALFMLWTRYAIWKREQPTQADALEEMARQVVQAAKQYLNDNAERKAYAVKMLYQLMEKAGITGISEDYVNMLIEWAVGQEKDAAKLYHLD